MNRIYPYIQLNSGYELLYYILPVALIYIGWSVYANYLTGERKFIKVGLASYFINNILIYALLAVAALINIKSIASLNLLVTAVNVLGVINLAYFLFEYIEEYKTKQPDPDHITRAHFKTSMHWVVLLVTLAFAMLPFGTYLLKYSFVYLALMFILTASVNHFIVRLLFKDVKSKK